jgi:hypothetical protein
MIGKVKKTGRDGTARQWSNYEADAHLHWRMMRCCEWLMRITDFIGWEFSANLSYAYITLMCSSFSRETRRRGRESAVADID